MIHGFDVSAFQGGTIPSCDFAFIKATEGAGYTSSAFAAQWASAKTHAKVRGAYHFARPEESSGASQADRLINKSGAKPGDMLCLDLEASNLSQAKTNAWAREFGDRLRAKAPGVTTVVYMGSGYASSNTGKGLSSHFDYWWYPQYPSAYQVANVSHEAIRAANRSDVNPASRAVISGVTHSWATAFSPWLPSGITTGWDKPHIWQFTDNFSGLDASISTITTAQLAGGSIPTPNTEEDMYGGQIPAGAGQQVNISFPKGALKILGLVQDNSLAIPGVIAAEPQAQVRYAFHGVTSGWQCGTVKVGSADAGKDHSPKATVAFSTPSDVDYVSLVRLDSGTRTVGWDMS